MKELFRLSLIPAFFTATVVLVTLFITATSPVERLPEKQHLINNDRSIATYYHQGHAYVVVGHAGIIHSPDCVCLTKLP